MKPAASLSTAIAGLVLPVLLAACGGAGAAATGPRTSATVQPRSAAPAQRPNGTTAREVSYRCNSGREGTITVDVPDLDLMADRLNGTQPCEYDQGLSRATVTVTCHSSPLVVRLTGAGGQIEQPSNESLCPR
jgi:hypothetical protein